MELADNLDQRFRAEHPFDCCGTHLIGPRQFIVLIAENIQKSGFESSPRLHCFARRAGHNVNFNCLDTMQFVENRARFVDCRCRRSIRAFFRSPDVEDSGPSVLILQGLICHQDINHLVLPLMAARYGQQLSL